jgi:hypothetical protein
VLEGWIGIIVQCPECGHMWADSVPPNWDGSPLMCFVCGEVACVEGVTRS